MSAIHELAFGSFENHVNQFMPIEGGVLEGSVCWVKNPYIKRTEGC